LDPIRWEVDQMEVMIERCAALDVHKKSITACVRTPKGAGRAEAVRTFSAFLDGLLVLRGWLLEQQVTHVAMEATSSYWLPVWRALEEPCDPAADADVGAPFELLLCNPRHVKHVPGRKTDVKDAQWLCQLLECGLLTGSFVPPAPVRALRSLTRYRKQLVQARTTETQRVEKVLEDAVIKIGAVASSTLTKSGRAMIEALIAGQRDPAVLAELAIGRMRPKIPELMRALDGRFGAHHAGKLRRLLDHIDYLDTAICDLDDRIVDLSAPWHDVIGRLQTIPGVGQRSAEIIVAETGADTTRFPTSGHLASWAGLCPGHNESGGKRRSGRTNPGDTWLAQALIESAWGAARTRDSYLRAKFWQIAGPRADTKRKKKAAVAVAHKILIAAYAIMASPDVVYNELGGDYLTTRDDPERRKARLVAQIQKLGYDVTLTPAA
jgi:transposase